MQRVVWLLFLVFCAGSMSCKKVAGIKAPKELSPLTKTEAEEFALIFGEVLNDCDPKAMNKVFDTTGLWRDVVSKSKVEARLQPSMLRESTQKGAELFTNFCKGTGLDDSLTLLRVHEQEGKQFLLYRAISNQALNYLDFHTGRTDNGTILVRDVYSYVAGQTLGETLVQSINGLVDNESLAKEVGEIAKRVPTAPKESLAELDALPADLRVSKPIQLLRVVAAASLDDSIYQKVITEYEELFPGDPSLLLVSLDGYALRKDYLAAYQSLDRIGEAIGGDSYLTQLRVGFLLEEKTDLPQATKLAEELLTAEPDNLDAHYLLLSAHVATHNFGGAVAIMQLMGERFELVFEAEGFDPSDADYSALKASPEWDSYLAR